MSSTISGLSSASWVSSLFSKIDTKNQGYIDKTELQSALEQITSSDSSTNVDKIFSKLDADNDGKITKQEMSDSVQKLAEELDNQFNQSRINAASAEDSGFTKDQLTSMIAEIGDSDSKRTTLMQSIVNNFDKADTNGDGKVSNSEAMTYDQTTNGTSSATGAAAAGGMPPPPPPSGAESSDSSSSSTSSGTKTYAAADTNKDGTVSLEELIAYQSANQTDTSSESLSVVKTLMQLMQAYGLSSAESSSAVASTSISAIA